MQKITSKKSLGQHFLKDEQTAKQIVSLLKPEGRYNEVLEVGPGMGVLTQHLFAREIEFRTRIVEIDSEAISYLQKKFPDHLNDIIHEDFLRMNLHPDTDMQVAIIGNFPYNISSQILFKVLDNKDLVPEVVGMFQHEVATRIASPPGNRDYGILSVLMQAFYHVEKKMTLNEEDFSPPPKVKSTVLRFERKENFTLDGDENYFRLIVKTAFNQRRKMLHNALKPLLPANIKDEKIKEAWSLTYFNQRAEELSWKEFMAVANHLMIFIDNLSNE